MNTYLISRDKLTQLAKSKKINTWINLINHVQNLPYGRNANRTDFSLVLSESQGTCSSKHALLKQLADLNEIPNVKLMLGMYKMNRENTPKIGNELIIHSLKYIPEAHCYLKIKEERFDFTSNKSEFQKIKKDILEEIEIEPHQVDKFKVEYHQEYIRDWIVSSKIELNFAEIWAIRERCIENLIKE